MNKEINIFFLKKHFVKVRSLDFFSFLIIYLITFLFLFYFFSSKNEKEKKETIFYRNRVTNYYYSLKQINFISIRMSKVTERHTV